MLNATLHNRVHLTVQFDQARGNQSTLADTELGSTGKVLNDCTLCLSGRLPLPVADLLVFKATNE